MSEVTEYLARARAGDESALDHVYELVYPELKRLASIQISMFRPGDTLTPTVLVNEAFLRIHGGASLELLDRRHLVACFARAIRFALVDHVRRQCAAKRGGGVPQVPLTDSLAVEMGTGVDLLEIDRAMEALGQVSVRLRELVELRFFGGLGEREIAELNGVSERTVRRDWRRARAFLHAQLAE